MVVAPTTPRVTVRPRHERAISPPPCGGRAEKEVGSLRKKPWVSSLGGALLVLFSPRGEKSTQMPRESKENGGGSKPPPYGERKSAGAQKMYLSARGGRMVPKERHQRAHALWKPMWPLRCFLTEHIRLIPRQMRGHSRRCLLSCAATQGRQPSDTLPAGGSQGAGFD